MHFISTFIQAAALAACFTLQALPGAHHSPITGVRRALQTMAGATITSTLVVQLSETACVA
ncbi:hypothetical protein GA830_09745 [Mesorhizobium sp. NBSH29]|uniref:hypothetical protein n=1 Tax=Mesorhizobium sp. NBSH29 TaxID=2654249 RepID=UPI0018969933|nr:hypothetical protein [Mesorhizobium sp. NBSH29]QPC86984.1 hypothetical protein GA830_09745 [Mesorhizobium sp. NBSH29]